MSYTLVDNPNPYTAQGTYPRRGGARLSGTIIIHTSEGPWQNGVASLTRLVQTRADYGCYHAACDWEDIEAYYPWEWETWQDSETNNWAVGIAAACKTTDWAVMPDDVREGFYRNLARMAADFVTYMADEHGIKVPLRRITGAEARARVPGFAAHGDSGIARSDPGRDFDWAAFFRYTAEALGTASIQPTPAKPAVTPSKPQLTKGPLMALNDKDQTELLTKVRELHRDLSQGIGGVRHDGDTFKFLRAIGAKLGVAVDEAARQKKYGKK